MIDFSTRYQDFSVFLPSASEMYVRYISNQKPKRIPPVPQSDLNFFDPNSNLFYFPTALYSAGQAVKSANSVSAKVDMFATRDRSKTTLIGDSGGFQIEQGSIKFKGDETRERMMRWLENNCDWSMILDFPTGGINIGHMDVHHDRLIKDGDKLDVQVGKKTKQMTLQEYKDFINKDENIPFVDGFITCLFQTLINNDYFVKHRNPGATKFLNVCQGRSISESNKWYEKIKHYPFEGWAMAGPHKDNFDMLLTRLIAMRRDGLLENKDWMHILGVGKLEHGCAYTTMQRMIRKHDNPNFTISYDVSSPFTTTAYGNIFLGYTLDKSGWTIQSTKLDGREFLAEYEHLVKDETKAIYRQNEFGKKEKVPYRGEENFLDVTRAIWEEMTPELERSNSYFINSEIGKKLKMKDLCVNIDDKFTSTWDVVTYAMLMNHNVQTHLHGVYDSQDLYDANDIDRVPFYMLELKGIIEEVLDPANDGKADSLIERYKSQLNCLAVNEILFQNTALFENGTIETPAESKARLVEVKKIENLKNKELSATDIFA
jgi:hypothetical protein